MKEYLTAASRDRSETVRSWMRERWYERLVPDRVSECDRLLFIDDIEILLPLVDTQITCIVDDTDRRDLMARVARKERLAELFEKGKISHGEYLAALNSLRRETGLPNLPLPNTGPESVSLEGAAGNGRCSLKETLPDDVFLDVASVLPTLREERARLDEIIASLEGFLHGKAS